MSFECAAALQGRWLGPTCDGVVLSDGAVYRAPWLVFAVAAAEECVACRLLLLTHT